MAMAKVLEYLLDYSAGELQPGQFDNIDASVAGVGRVNASGALRYGGYPGNRKCISYYPDHYRKLVDAGKRVVLAHQIAYNDFLGGRKAGQQHARILKADGERIGYPDQGLPYFACFDRFLAGNPAKGITPTTLDVVYDYMEGWKDVVGWDDSGLYGFFDIQHPAIRDNLVHWNWLCGAGSQVIDGVDVWQFNNGFVYPAGMQADINFVYTDMFAGGDTMPSAEELWNVQIERTPGAVDKRPTASAAELLRYANEATWDTNTVAKQILGEVRAQRELLAAATRDPNLTAAKIGEIVAAAQSKVNNDFLSSTATQVLVAVKEGIDRLIQQHADKDLGTKVDAVFAEMAVRLASATPPVPAQPGRSQ
jgi:hypothetical protein